MGSGYRSSSRSWSFQDEMRARVRQRREWITSLRQAANKRRGR